MNDLETRIRAILRDLADQADRSSSPDGMPKPFRRRVLRRRARTATIATLATGAVIAAAVAGVQWLSSGTTAQPANNPKTASHVNGAFAIARHDGIYQVQPDGSGLRKVADCPLPDCDGTASPAWSPDGSKIVFAALSKEGGAGEGLFVVDADGSSLTRLTDCAPPGCGQDWDPAWSPDGSKIVFTRLGKGSLDQAIIELYVVNADGSGLGSLADLPGYAETPAWSPDGTRIAFDLQDDNGQRIEVIHADGSHRSVILQEPPGSGPGAPAWSPDGSRIAFVRASSEGNPDIFVMNADGSHATRLTTDPSPDVDPVWSPDGSKIAFVRTGSGGELFIMDADGGDPQLVVKDVLGMSWQALPAR